MSWFLKPRENWDLELLDFRIWWISFVKVVQLIAFTILQSAIQRAWFKVNLTLLMVKCPKKVIFVIFSVFMQKLVHFSIKRYPIDELPADSTEQMGQWLNERWEEKEEKLKKFYKNDKKFHNSRHPYWDRRTLSIWVALIFWPVFRWDSLKFSPQTIWSLIKSFSSTNDT